MARRGRGRSEDERRFPDFEGIGPGFAGDVNYPGANRGDVGVGAFQQPKVRGPQSRLDGLRASRGRSAQPVQGPGALPARVRPSTPSAAAPAVGASGRPVQGATGALPPGGGPRNTGRRFRGARSRG